MSGHGRPPSANAIAPLAAVLLVLGSVALAGPTRKATHWPAELLEDAELSGVFFLDATLGWAVGDRGVIWHTRDGGHSWDRQASGVRCRLEAVSFLDEETGWVVGGWSEPYTHRSLGVVLRTSNGGQTWSPVQGLLLPALKQVQFLDSLRGWAVGQRSTLYPSGVFRTLDGGRSWRALPGPTGPAWLAADFRDVRGGVVCGRGASVAVVGGEKARPFQLPRVSLRDLRGVRLDGPRDALLVGDGGLIMSSIDGGGTWSLAWDGLPEGVNRQFDFNAVAVHEGHYWIAGSPGTRVLHTEDAGRSWEVLSTGQSLPINDLTFIDPQQGWAVGALGTILSTSDGGHTWQQVRGDGRRAAVVGVFGRPADVPLEVFAQLSGSDGYLAQVEVIGRHASDTQSAGRAAPATRLHDALVSVGACGAHLAWSFPVPERTWSVSPDRVVAGWDRIFQGRGVEQVIRHVVRQIRQWRPDVVVTRRGDFPDADPLAQVVHRVVLHAVELAADAEAYQDQIDVAGLQTWQVKKVYGAAPGQINGAVHIDSSQLALPLSRSLAELAMASRGLLQTEFHPSSHTTSLVLLDTSIRRSPSNRVFAGIDLDRGGEARRQLATSATSNLSSLRRMAQKRRNAEALMARSEAIAGSGANWLAHLHQMTDGLSSTSAGELLYQLAHRYQFTGQGKLAAETLRLLAEKHPDHPLCSSAYQWLMQHETSGEAAWRQQQQQQQKSSQSVAAQVSGWQPLDTAAGQTEVVPATLQQPRGFAPAAAPGDGPSAGPTYGQKGVLRSSRTRADRPTRALELASQLQRTRPALFAEPAIRFAVAAVQRRRNQLRLAQSFYRNQLTAHPDAAWQACAQGELWLSQPRGHMVKPVQPCALARKRPHLDGSLDEALWQSAKPVQLASPQGDDDQWPARALLAYDREFLFIAIQCHKAAGAVYPPQASPRSRDADLTDRDRVELLIDIDRDYASYWRLTVDHRGWAAESLLGDTTWDPQWYVSAADSAEKWTIEAAIPMAELAPQPPQPGDIWAVGLQRTVPGVGFQSWTRPAGADVRPEGFGYLKFSPAESTP